MNGMASKGISETNPKSMMLDSWKEIAVFLRRGVRTVQRWERTEGLPVRRHQHLKRGSVCALSSELADWQRARQTGFRVPAPVPARRPAMDQIVRLKSLMSRQALLAKELTDLLVVRAEIENTYRRAGFRS